jgi:two-component system sensor kinase
LYLSPEQAGAMDVDVGEPSDLYSVGILLYECVSGRPPFTGTSVGEILFQHMTSPVPELRLSGAEVPAAWEEFLQRLLRKDPRDRYQSAEGALHDVVRLASALERGEQAPTVVLGLNDHRRSLTEPAFVARTSERASLAAELAATRAGAARLVLIEGETERRPERQTLWFLPVRTQQRGRPRETQRGRYSGFCRCARDAAGRRLGVLKLW